MRPVTGIQGKRFVLFCCLRQRPLPALFIWIWIFFLFSWWLGEVGIVFGSCPGTSPVIMFREKKNTYKIIADNVCMTVSILVYFILLLYNVCAYWIWQKNNQDVNANFHLCVLPLRNSCQLLQITSNIFSTWKAFTQLNRMTVIGQVCFSLHDNNPPKNK